MSVISIVRLVSLLSRFLPSRVQLRLRLGVWAACWLACVAVRADQSISLDWGPSPTPGVTGYAVYYGTTSGWYDQRLDAGTNLAAVITGLAGGQTYFFAAAAYDTNGTESVPSNEVSFAIPGIADLGISITAAPPLLSPGGVATYTVIVTNAGPDIASGILVSNSLSAGAIFVDAATSQGTFMANGNLVTFDLGWIPPGTTATLTVAVTRTSVGTVTNSAAVSAAISDPNRGNNLASTSVAMVSSVPPGSIAAVTLTTLVSFDGMNGANPYAAIVQAKDGNFYGTTAAGGTGGAGTIFRMTPAGALTSLVSFNRANGAGPFGSLVQGLNGNFYGTTLSGGASSDGTIFRMTASGGLTTLISFDGTNGAMPYAGLVQGNDGGLYGTTLGGEVFGLGTAFRASTDGILTTLAAFDSTAYLAYGGLAPASDGCFYGTAATGWPYGSGSVFRIQPAGPMTTLLTFDGANGSSPQGSVFQAGDGNFYGTTFQGGPSDRGTVFRLGTNGTLTVMGAFNGANGANPLGGLVQGADGNFYGTTDSGGAYSGRSGSGYGTIFQLTTNGTLTTLVSFNGTNGANPAAGLIPGTDGNFYGTTVNGGLWNQGTIYRLTVVPTPVLHAALGNSGALVLTWPAKAGQLYQVRTCADLNRPVWRNLGKIITATNTIASFSTPLGPERQRFYRVSLLLGPQPIFPVLTPVGGGLSLSWNSIPGQYYQVQYKTNLLQPNWLDLGFPLPATDTLSSIAIVIGPDPQRFYRVVLLSGPPPVRPSLSQAGGALTLSWNSVLGQSYQVQSTTNLLQPNWINLGNPVAATNTTMTAADVVGSDPQRFYRVIPAP